MKRYWFLHVLRFVFFAALFLAVASFIVMGLWNWAVTPATGWHELGYWQAMGLLVLSKILFGGFHAHGARHWHWRHRMHERWANMTPEEREKFRRGMHARCGSFRQSGEELKTSQP